MGLACSQIRLLTLTSRKADIECNLQIDSIEKMALTREQSELAREFNNRLQAKNVSYYANGKYNQINYGYLMGYGNNFEPIKQNSEHLKKDKSTILCDYKGQVVLSKAYANAICAVLGTNAMDEKGVGGTFSKDNIPKILAKLLPGVTEDDVKGNINKSTSATNTNSITQEANGSSVIDTTAYYSSNIKALVNFYYPIFLAAASNGWTSEYNNEMEHNANYVNDALNSGSFQLEKVDEQGNYETGTSLSYFLMNDSDLDSRTNSEQRQELTAWYEEEKARIQEKENFINLDIENLSTELEAIKQEVQAIENFIKDNIENVFNWGGG